MTHVVVGFYFFDLEIAMENDFFAVPGIAPTTEDCVLRPVPQPSATNINRPGALQTPWPFC
jgi:hypothetical protein